ncbi:hypothetical protein ZOSMA_270G00240 [Zostera marina]|uniref:DYW domain-containing protein n=1 Tax=Zostera marina TaxID=29655 RepID=A0A0K9PE73_ZOSMR|nr:hypothetical protein ZOSMA_270G00240 [Zostera marina]
MSFPRLIQSSDEITNYVLLALLKGCGRLKALRHGKCVHGMILKHGFRSHLPIMTSVLDMYSNCFRLQEARKIFLEIERPDAIVINGMIAAYFRCYRPSDAVGLFYDSPSKDVGTWNSVLSGLVRISNNYEALRFFKQMVCVGEKSDVITLVTVLSACGSLAASCNARQIHGIVVKHGHEKHIPVGNAIIDMYAKVGEIEDAYIYFKNTELKNVITWTSLIVGYGKHGLGIEAIATFQQMVIAGFVPNKVTFVGILSACSHAGLVRQGLEIYRCMTEIYGIEPEMIHYGCVVDLLARYGQLEEAWKFITTMPVQPDSEMWTSFLSSCYFHKNKEFSKIAMEKLLELNPEDAGSYVLLSNVCSWIGDLEGVAKARRWIMNKGIVKTKAQTWIEIDRTVHGFESGGRSHPNYDIIVKYLGDLLERIKAVGYVPNIDIVVQNVDDNLKEEMIRNHSEKLAIGFGLINTKPGTRIVIVKNLRVCSDCHAAIGFISKMEGREIVARDSTRFHRFRDGKCSCREHW